MLVAGGLFVMLAAVLVPWSPIPGGRPPSVAAEDLFTAAELARIESFARTARWIGWSSLAVSVAVSLLLGLTPLGRRLVHRIGGPWWCRVILAATLVLLIARLATLPLALASREHRLESDLTRQALGPYLRDVAVSWVVSVVVTSAVLLVIVGFARRWRETWPALAAAVLAGLTLGASYGYPVLVEPLFNRFEPMPAGELRTEVLALADREGVAVDDVLVADASRRTTTLNAYVSGIGSTRRVVLYDTLVEDLPLDQALAVIAHEVAHARHRDVLAGSVLGALGAATGIGLLGVILGGQFGGQHRMRGPRLDDPEVVPLLIALVTVATLLVAPLQSGVSRRVETRADVTALEATGDGAAMEAMQRILALRSLADPTPPRWSYLWFATHPTVLERIALARTAR